MEMRGDDRCAGCGTPLRGRKKHGFVRGNRRVCGRAEIPLGWGKDKDGKDVKVKIKTPQCKA